ncbi:very-long-chain enoyl-CoA reductase-like [Solea senegalensis]|uniref:Very-long-chain enoyl-CoA reductase n=1 Tax=Solea senegalensis TaxID=28829 RepID=A0AAV6TCR8_SOLSE|nr:very-long-chain enoyl-CoA reductase [Solea senegalensis]KAG7526876.1 very-long-chain enoyl-CoA reductase-like [Solea senegalensis]
MSRTTFFEVEVLDANTRELLCFLDKVEPYSTIGDIKSLFHKSYPHWYPARQALKLNPKGKLLRDDEILQNLPVGTCAIMYFRDLGPQLGWTMVFLAEYIGPLLTYLLFYFRVPYMYSHRYVFTSSPHSVVTRACVCHTVHYMKRLIETIFVHRFSHGTMPLRIIVRNCAYYWGFSAWLAYYINHPLYTPPSYGDVQVNFALVIFAMCQLGNFSIHLTLIRLKGDGARSRRYPIPTKNPFTWLFFFVSCPNYTYEVGAWVSFSIMTQCLPVAFYTLLGFIQMTIWAKGKHKAYSREFKDYPRFRMAIIPLIL